MLHVPSQGNVAASQQAQMVTRMPAVKLLKNFAPPVHRLAPRSEFRWRGESLHESAAVLARLAVEIDSHSQSDFAIVLVHEGQELLFCISRAADSCDGGNTVSRAKPI